MQRLLKNESGIGVILVILIVLGVVVVVLAIIGEWEGKLKLGSVACT